MSIAKSDLIKEIANSYPNFLKKDLEIGLKFLDLLVNAKIMSSKSEARRAINNNGIKINDELVVDENKILNLIKYGKKSNI